MDVKSFTSFFKHKFLQFSTPHLWPKRILLQPSQVPFNSLPVTFHQISHEGSFSMFSIVVINELLQNVRQNKETLGLNEEDIVNLAKTFGA